MDGELCSHFFPWVPSLYDHLQLFGPWGTSAEKRWTLEVREFVLSVKRALEDNAWQGRLILPTRCCCSCHPRPRQQVLLLRC